METDPRLRYKLGEPGFLGLAQVLDSFFLWKFFRCLREFQVNVNLFIWSWLTNCMVNELSIRYEPVLTGSHFSREPLGLRSNCFKKKLKEPAGSGSRILKFWKNLQSSSRPGSSHFKNPGFTVLFKKNWNDKACLVPNWIQFYRPTHSPKLEFLLAINCDHLHQLHT